jgi:hypothetical protein
MENILRNLIGVPVEQGVVLHNCQGMVGLFQNSHELEDCKARRISRSWSLRCIAQDGRVVHADEEGLEPRQVEGLDGYLIIGGYQCVEVSWPWETKGWRSMANIVG